MWGLRKKTSVESEPQDTSPYHSAIRLTTQTIDIRSARFKRLVIDFVFVGSISIVLTVVLGSGLPLLGLLFLPLLIGIFLCSDTLLVNHWREGIMALWEKGELDLQILPESLVAVPGMPRKTLQGLLATLPKFASSERKPPLAIRKALSLTQKMIGQLQIQRIILATSVAVGGLTFPVVALVLGNWLPLLGYFAIPLIWVLVGKRHQRRVRMSRKTIDHLCQEEGRDAKTFGALAENLDWSGLPPRLRADWLASGKA